MKILFLLNIGFDRGGPSVHLLQDVLRAALNRGHTVDVILKETGGQLEMFPADIASNDRFHYNLIRELPASKGFIARYLDEVSYACKCKKIYRKQKYDAVFVQSCNAALFCVMGLKALKCPIIYNVQDIFPYNLYFSSQLPMRQITFPILRKLQNMAYKRSDKIITISDDMKQTLVEDGVDSDKIEVVYNWSYSDQKIELNALAPEQIYDLKTDPAKTNVIYAGNIGKMQNVELIANAVVLSKDDTSIHYYIIGEGANKHRVEELVAGLTNVTVLPMLPACYAESIYAQADINLIPLARGGIKTALPSKTATVLRTNTNVVFCIDAGSAFEKIVADEPRICVADNTDPASLYGVICDIRDRTSAKGAESKNLSATLFSRENAAAYVEIIEGAHS